MIPSDDAEAAEFASSPCSLHELSPEMAGTARSRAAELTPDNAIWRKAERKRLIDARMAIAASDRARMDEAITTTVEQLIGDPQGKIVSAYWPFRCEPELRPLLRRLSAAGAQTALPVVLGKGRPMVFREWTSGARLERGVWNIPFPADGAEVAPDIVIAPVVGFDTHCYRLGYGGGFFDRTLESLPHMPLRIGVGYAMQRLDTIHPHRYDIAMSHVVTEEGIALPEDR